MPPKRMTEVKKVARARVIRLVITGFVIVTRASATPMEDSKALTASAAAVRMVRIRLLVSNLGLETRARETREANKNLRDG